MTSKRVLPSLLVFIGVALSACKLDTKSLLGGNAGESSLQAGVAQPSQKPDPQPSVGSGASGEIRSCQYATLKGTDTKKAACLAPGGPSNWLAKVYYGKNLPGGEAADGPVLRLVFRFLRDGAAPELARETITARSALGMTATLVCKTVAPEFTWQARVYDCRWDKTPSDLEYQLEDFTVLNSNCQASTRLSLVYDDGSECVRVPTLRPGYPLVYLGHGIQLPPIRRYE